MILPSSSGTVHNDDDEATRNFDECEDDPLLVGSNVGSKGSNFYKFAFVVLLIMCLIQALGLILLSYDRAVPYSKGGKAEKVTPESICRA
jgi:hypothetical protein